MLQITLPQLPTFPMSYVRLHDWAFFKNTKGHSLPLDAVAASGDNAHTYAPVPGGMPSH